MDGFKELEMKKILLYRQPETYPVSLAETDENKLPLLTKEAFNRIKDKFKDNIKVSDFPLLLSEAYGRKFELFDKFTWNKAEFISYLIDRICEFKSGKPLDLSQIHTDILTAYDFTKEEKRLFLEQSVEEVLWAIFLLLNNPAHEKLNIDKND